MDQINTRVRLIIGAIIVIVLQVLIAPVVSINSAMPNFLLAFAIASAVARPDQIHLIFGFFMGLLFDLISGGPVGAMAFSMVVVMYVMQKIMSRLENPKFGITFLAILLSTFVIECIYGTFQIALSINSTFVDMIFFKVFPCTLYDIILCVIMFPIMSKVLAPPPSRNYYSDKINFEDRG